MLRPHLVSGMLRMLQQHEQRADRFDVVLPNQWATVGSRISLERRIIVVIVQTRRDRDAHSRPGKRLRGIPLQRLRMVTALFPL